MSNIFSRLLKRITPNEASTAAIRADETLSRFVWRASGAHQFYVGLIAIAVAQLNFVPIDLQRQIVDVAIANGDIGTLVFLGALYLGIILSQAALKYVLLVYRGWVGESAVKILRDQLAAVASEKAPHEHGTSGQTVNVIAAKLTASATS